MKPAPAGDREGGGVVAGQLHDGSPGTSRGGLGPPARPVPLLDDAQLAKHEQERHASSGATVSHIKRSRTNIPILAGENFSTA